MIVNCIKSRVIKSRVLLQVSDSMKFFKWIATLALLIASLSFSQDLTYAQTTHTGVWIFTYDSGDVIFTPQISTLMEKNFVIEGDGIAGPYRYTVTGAVGDSTVSIE